MEFANRIKKEMSEGIIRALLEDAGYRVIDCGIEKVIRELSCLSPDAYNNLGYPDAMRHLPDFAVMDKDQTKKHLVEVKYRAKWDKAIFTEVKEQVRIFGTLILISVNAEPPPSKRNLEKSPSRFLRSCQLKFDGEIYKIETRSQGWVEADKLGDVDLWWEMKSLQEQFPQIKDRKEDQSLYKAVQALQGILDNHESG